MKLAFTDRPKIDFKKSIAKLYKNKEGVALNTIDSTPAQIITIKERETSKVIGQVDNIDPVKFRQGVEITADIHRMRGIVDISCGIEGNFFENLVIGQTLEREDNNYFSDNNQQFESDIRNLMISGDNGSGAVLPFYRLHFSGSDGFGLNVNIRETTRDLYNKQEIVNGAIKIFDEKAFFSSNVSEHDASPRTTPANRVRKQININNQFPVKEVASQPFIEKFPNTLSLQKSIVSDNQKPLETGFSRQVRLAILNGNREIKLISANAIVKTDKNRVINPGTLFVMHEDNEHFNDSAIPHKTSRLIDNMSTEMRGVLLAMSGSGVTDDYIGDNHRSAKTGFMFDDAQFGTDSIAFR